MDSGKLEAIIYSVPFSITSDTKLSTFQYKIIHEILPYGCKLHIKMKNLINM